MPEAPPKDATARIRAAYQKRIEEDVFSRYSLFRPGELYMLQRREQDILALLRRAGLSDLSDHRVLEVGCGRGYRLADWLRWGAMPENLAGLDLMEDFLARARRLLPLSDLQCGSAEHLPWPDHHFHIVVQQTVFTSVPDTNAQSRIAREMRRVTRPGGHILWYDFRYPNPRNPDVRPVRVAQVRALFPDCRIQVRSTTLLPPLARMLAPVSFGLCRLMEHLPPLRSHLLALIQVPHP